MSNSHIEVREMLGDKKPRQENLFSPRRKQTKIGRELSELKRIIDFGWLRDACEKKFASDGRPSIAPEVFGAMILLGFWFNITSDRELCEQCDDRLSFREFIGVSDDDEIPVHSSLTHWRKRLGKEVFQEFLKHSLSVAIEKGMKLGRCRMFDSTLVKAQADSHGSARIDLDPIINANDYLDALGEWEDADQRNKKKEKMASGKSIAVNTNDLDAKLLSRPGKKTDFFHKAHVEYDSFSSLVINADSGHIFEPVKMIDFLSNEPYPLDTVMADTGYFDVISQRWLKEKNIISHICVRDNSNNAGRAFGIDSFLYNTDLDEFICPENVVLKRQGTASNGEKRYASPKWSCNNCNLKAYCFKPGCKANRRQLIVSAGRELTEEARLKNQCHRYKRLRKIRSVVCEGSFGTMKYYGGLGRARWIGEESMAIQTLMAGVVHNFKKILKFLNTKQAQLEPALISKIGIFTIFMDKYRLQKMRIPIAA